MAEGEPDKTLTLAQQWFVQEKEEQAGLGETPIKAAEDGNPTSATSVEVVTSEEVVEAATEEVPATEESSEAPEQAESEEQDVVEQKPEVKIETAPVDFRFPTTNQTRHCFTRYIEYHRCIAAKGEGAPECEKFAKYYRSLCPSEWVERWNEQRENGTFPGPL